MKDIYKIEQKTIPVIPMRGLWVMPFIVKDFEIGRSISKKALEESQYKDTDILLLNQIDIKKENPKEKDFYEYGVIGKVREVISLPSGITKVLIATNYRAKVNKLHFENGFYSADVDIYTYDEKDIVVTKKIETLRRLCIEGIVELDFKEKNVAEDFSYFLREVTDVSSCCDMIATYTYFQKDQYYNLIKTLDIQKRYEYLYKYIKEEIEYRNISKSIDKKMHINIEKTQKEMFLREKLSIIKKELNQTMGKKSQGGMNYTQRIQKLPISSDDKEVLLKEVEKLEFTAQMSPDASVIRSYLDYVLDLPWNKKTKDTYNLKKAEIELDKNHYGLEEVKERILDSIAVRKKKQQISGSIICLSGPPGVGKTSIVQSIAKSLGRKFVSMRLGGVTDESEIRGHRKTYVGAMSGRIIQNINKVHSSNPVFLLDEIDKLGNDFRGDPSSALLEVLDPKQNNEFIDRYVSIPFDLSDVLFITTANDISRIPHALYDRLEIIEIAGYTLDEKVNIARKHLIKKALENHGLTSKELSINKACIIDIIKNYTRESGVRQLYRLISTICRKSVRKILETNKKIIVTQKNLSDFIGKKKFFDDNISTKNQVGLVNGLAWTAVGGTILNIEAITMKGNGKVILTGSLGDVMKESAQAAISYIRSNAKKYEIDEDFINKIDIHIHAPEGATPKDGPSAGITMTCAIASVLTNKKVRKDIAMTGEVTIRGRVLPIGGLKEKALAAFNYGIKDIIIPKDNEKDIDDIPQEIRDKINFIKVSDVDEVIKRVLI